MTGEELDQLERTGGWVNLSARAKWRLTGADRVRYLNGQVTQDVRKASDTAAVYACVTDVKGRICGDVWIRSGADPDCLLVDAETDLAESLGMRLERYIIADDVELEEVTDEWALWHAWGKAAEDRAGVVSDRLGVSGVDVWLPAGQGPDGVEAPVSGEDFETLRVVLGVPRFPSELNAETFPPEARLEERAMDFAKGCYIGQEILSRIRTTGKMPRTLVHWVTEVENTEIEVEAAVFDASQRQVGKVTSVVRDPRTGFQVGLAYVKQANGTDSELLVGPGMARIRASSQPS